MCVSRHLAEWKATHSSQRWIGQHLEAWPNLQKKLHGPNHRSVVLGPRCVL